MKLSAEHFNFGEALEHLKNGLAVTRHAWENNMFVVKQINADIDEKVIPHMTSLPQKVKELILQTECKSISYQQQCLIVQLTDNGNIATNYIPNWIDIFADDWTIVVDIV